MENKIRFILNKFEKALCFQITEQSIKNYKRSPMIKIGKYTIKIKVDYRPDILIDKDGHNIKHNITIWLRGSSYDHYKDIIIKKFRDNEERDEIYELILESFKRLYNGK